MYKYFYRDQQSCMYVGPMFVEDHVTLTVVCGVLVNFYTVRVTSITVVVAVRYTNLL